MNLTTNGFYKVSAANFTLSLCQPKENSQKISQIMKELHKSAVVVFPELALTGYSCEDLFFQQSVKKQVEEALSYLITESLSWTGVAVVGLPWWLKGQQLFNCAAVIGEGKIYGMVPKTYLPNYGEFYEKRWFTSGKGVNTEIKVKEQSCQFSSNQLFSINNGEMLFGVEICEDLWVPIPPSINLSLAGADLIVNLSASDELVGKKDYRNTMLSAHTSRLHCAYLYCSSNSSESTKDLVFGGHLLAYENGSLLAESELCYFHDNIIHAEIDVQKLRSLRTTDKSFLDQAVTINYPVTDTISHYQLETLTRQFSLNPFVPTNSEEAKNRFEGILDIQAHGLARRIMAAKAQKLLLGLSGGLDSTLASLVAIKALGILNRPTTDLITVSMPGFGTSTRTREQAARLAKVLKSTFLEIDITKTTTSHLNDIQHTGIDTVFENAQARERTQVLFDLSNKENGLVVGTGSLSELALGWCTFNGDHMASYAVNSSVPKTLIRYLVGQIASYGTKSVAYSEELETVLTAIINTKMSPELLPNNTSDVVQVTEDTLGSYQIHDFILFYFLRYGFSAQKIRLLADHTLSKIFTVSQLDLAFGQFFTRFFKHQFKRTTLPPGAKVGSVSLSPRGDWRMPDEILWWEQK